MPKILVPDAAAQKDCPRFRKTVVLLCMGVMLICSVVLLGWALDNRTMKSVGPGMITMKVNTAIGLLLLTTVLSGICQRGRAWRFAVSVSLGLVLALTLATLSEYALSVDLKIDNLLFQDHESVRFPGRNAPATNIAFLGLAAALGLLFAKRWMAFAQALLLVVSAAPLATLGGYLYRAPAMYQNAPYAVIALNTSVALLMLCIGGLFSRADGGLMLVITSRTPAGSLARRLLPMAVGLPAIIGMLVLVGEEIGLYSTAFGSALMVAGCAIFFTAAVLVAIVRLWDAQRQMAESLQEQLRLLEAERAARADAERANRLKDEFLSLVSHELRTPLTAMLGWSQLLQVRKSPDEIDEGLAIIVDNAHAQRQIIDDLLDMGRIISGKLKLKPTSIDVGAVLKAAIESVRLSAESKGVRLTAEVPDHGLMVVGDPTRLQQIFWNLLTNAIKFTERGGAVKVTAGMSLGACLIQFTDTGGGIDPSFLPFVFDRFRQADASTSRRHGGLGLGLSIVKQLIELHGGTVQASSPGTGRGSTFTVRLPAESAAQPNVSTPAVMTEKRDAVLSAIPSHDVAGLRVLAIDDEPDTRALIKRRLEDWGAKCDTAGSGDEVLHLLRESQFDVLISDIGMPGEDGYALIKRVRSLEPAAGGNIPAIALTAYARPEDRVKVLEAGFQLHLTKPIEQAELRAGLARVALMRSA